MGQRIYLKLDGIEGGCAGERRGWMELTNVSESLTSNDGRENTAWHDVSISRLCDRATPLLARAAAQGRRFPEALVEICDGGDVVQIRLKLTDVAFRSWALSSVRENPEPAPFENLSLTAAGVEWTWQPGSPAPVRTAYASQSELSLGR